MEVRKNTLPSNNLPNLFKHNKNYSGCIDQSYLSFPIPSAKDLYYKIIWRDNFELICKLSFDEIKQRLIKNGCDLAQLSNKYDINNLTETYYHYTFYFKKLDTQSDLCFSERQTLIKQLNQLRYLDLNYSDLIPDSTISMQLHLSNSESYDFASNNQANFLPNAYRAHCLYDLIIEDLYLHNLQRNDYNYQNTLISDYLSVHTSEFDGLDQGNHNYDITIRISACLKNITRDMKAAELLKISFDHYHYGNSFKRGVLEKISLSQSAALNTNPVADKYFQLNKYSHHYFSLIQYRYLLDLEYLASQGNNPDSRHTALVKEQLTKVKAEMTKWKDFKDQPLIKMADDIVELIEELLREKYTDYVREYDYQYYLWTNLYWEESVRLEGQKKLQVITFKPFNNNRGASLPLDFVIYIQNELARLTKNNLQLERYNNFASSDEKYKNGYYLLIKQDALIKNQSSLIHSVNNMGKYSSSNLSKTKSLLFKQRLFESKTPQHWLEVLHYQNAPSIELDNFIWKLATWPKLKNLLYVRSTLLPGDYIPLELIHLISDVIARALQQENNYLIFLQAIADADLNEVKRFLKINPHLIADAEGSITTTSGNTYKNISAIQLIYLMDDLDLCEMTLPFIELLPESSIKKIHEQLTSKMAEVQLQREQFKLYDFNLLIQAIMNDNEYLRSNVKQPAKETITELSRFKKYFSPEVIIFGKSFIKEQILAACKLFNDTWNEPWNGYKKNWYLINVIGHLQTLVEKCFEHECSQGLYSLLELNKTPKRSDNLNITHWVSQTFRCLYIPSIKLVGRNYFVDMDFGKPMSVCYGSQMRLGVHEETPKRLEDLAQVKETQVIQFLEKLELLIIEKNEKIVMSKSCRF